MNIKLPVWILLLFAYPIILSLNLLELPLYLDEGLYIFWSYLFSGNQAFAYISMQDGKTPLFIWLVSWFNYFDNFLFTGRFISVIASTISMISWLFIGYKILGQKILFWVFLLFLITPFNALISRLAFVDSLLIGFTSLSILGIFLIRESVEKNRIIKSFILAILSGVFLGLAFYTKTTAKLFLVAEIIILGFWIVPYLKERRFRVSALVAICGLMIAGIYFEMQGYLKFGALKYWEMIANKESVLVFSLPELHQKMIEGDFSTHLKNIPVTLEYLFYYFGPVLVFFASGIYWILKHKKHLWLLILTSILIAGVFLSAKIPASRYLAIIIPEVLVISAIGLYGIWQKGSRILRIISLSLLLISAFLTSKIIFDPLNAFYSNDDRANFVDYNLNTLGLRESVQYLEARKDTAVVAITGTWGIAEGAQVAFKEKGVEVYATTRPVTANPKEGKCEENQKELDGKCWRVDFGDVTKSPKEKYVYFINEVIDIERLKKLDNIEVVKEFKRPRTNLNVYLIKLLPDN